MRGVLRLCVLKSLEPGPTYGYAIAAALDDAGLGAIKGGTLYPLLSRLETGNLLRAQWRAGDGGPGRKFFELTDAGHAELAALRIQWEHFSTLVTTHLTAEEHRR